VPVTLASDAHQPDLVGEDYEAALKLLRATGISDVAVFTARDRRLEALPS
jgi:histidinol phosphatase-like PHP family hydrolase